MDKKAAIQKLKAIKQEHILSSFHSLTPSQQSHLLNEIEKLDVKIFHAQQAALFDKKDSRGHIEPFTDAIKSEDIPSGKDQLKMLEEGKIGCLLVAGGQGTRLQFKGPKGTYLVSPVKKKSLFQIFAEKILAAGKLAKRPLLIAIMLSEENSEETKKFFKENNYFGLSQDQLFFFCQKSLPMLNSEGALFLDTPSSIAKGADGNGGSLKQFFNSGIYDQWKARGVQFVNYVLIDNPLADPFDEKLLFFQSRQKEDVLVKCIKRENPEENVGILAKVNDALSIIEYSEINENERLAKNSQGELMHPFANISLFSFSMDFIEKAAKQIDQMPLHKTFKPSEKGLKGWKFERFIFDALAFAKHILVIEYLRKDCFSPLKNKEGLDSLKTVQMAMQIKDLETIRKITKCNTPVLEPFEIAKDFYYPTDELKNKWQQKPIPNEHYIEP